MTLLAVAAVLLLVSSWWVCAKIAKDNRDGIIRQLKQDVYADERHKRLRDLQRATKLGDRR